jgi:hypothetical protein
MAGPGHILLELFGSRSLGLLMSLLCYTGSVGLSKRARLLVLALRLAVLCCLLC